MYSWAMSSLDRGDPSSAKAAIPIKKSLFERQKAEAEAKRIKEQEETAAVYEDFVKSFDHEGKEEEVTDDHFGSSSRPFPKRHFPPPNGLGRGASVRGRGSGPGSLGPSPAFSKKRTLESRPSYRDNLHGAFTYDEPEHRDVKSAFQDDDDDIDHISRTKAQEKAAARPTLHLSSLPPGTSVAVVKSFLAGNLTVDGVKFISSGLSERQGTTAIVTLSEGTPAADIDSAVSNLQSRYLGWGFYLSIARHLSSAVTNSNLPSGTSSTLSPFGAKAITNGPQYSLSRAPPQGQRGFAPPSSYGPGGLRSGAPTQVNVKPPTNLKQLKLIHKTVESIITHGPEFEALLMSRSEAQRDEKWAWLWNSRSEGGVYYRWRLWDILTNAQQRLRSGTGRTDGQIQALFESGSRWCMPESKLPYEYTTTLEEVVSNSDYDSSEDEDSGDESRKRLERLQGAASTIESAVPGENDVPAYLNPMHKAKLVHLLSRLPTTTARMRRGDVARITAFAISHAGAGADEIVSLLTLNIHRPFSRIALNTSKDPDEMDTGTVDDREKDKEDPASSKLIGLYLVSDILSSSSTSGVRHAWRYRALFEAALQSHGTFAHLGRLEKDFSWGKLRAEKWKRSVLVLLSLWEGWCVFPAKSQEEFVKIFNNPPLSEEEQLIIAREERERMEKEKTKSKWKAVTADETSNEIGDQDIGAEAMDEDLDGEPMIEEDLDGEPMVEDEDLDGEPMIVEDIVEDNLQAQKPPDRELSPVKSPISAAQESRRRRPKAEDMFADPDGK